MAKTTGKTMSKMGARMVRAGAVTDTIGREISKGFEKAQREVIFGQGRMDRGLKSLKSKLPW